MPLILGTNSIKDTGYNVANSLRFNDGSSDYLNRTPGSAGNRKTFTFSTWVKRGVLGDKIIFAAGADSNVDGYVAMYFSGEALRVRIYESSAKDVVTSMLFRDLSAWYNIVVAVDTTQGTAANRVKIYVNGSEAAKASGSYVSEDFDTSVNNAVIQQVGVGRDSSGSLSNYFDGYLAETVLIDGTALNQTSFGEFDTDSPTIWKPKAVSGLTFGTNGFYLEFKESGTSQNSSGLGADTSGNDHHFAVNNLTAIDQSIDTCTNNFCTLNPLQIGPRNNQSESAGTFTEGNLNVLGTGTGDDFAGTIAVSTGKWFYEVKLLTALNHGAGFVPLDDFTSGDSSISNGIVNAAQQYGSHEGGTSSKIANNGDTSVSPQNNFADDDIISFAFDIDGGTLKIYNNGSLDRTISSIPAGTYIPIGGDSSSTDASLAFNFGSPAYSESGGNSDGSGYGNFSMAVPSGYFSICTKNLAEYG